MPDREKDWKAMVHVGHDFFHRWRQAVEERYGREEASALSLRFWEMVAEGTAENYQKAKINPDDLKGIVQAMARSSEIMGEHVRVEEQGGDILLVHDGCPWIRSYAVYGAEGQCQPGCDRWFEVTLLKLSPNYEVITESSLAGGAPTCTRRFHHKSR